MQYTVKCKKPKEYPSIVHVDGTSRVQTLRFSDNPKFYTLLSLWYNKTNCPMFLNTSLNIKGEPMINDEKNCLDWQNQYKVKIFS